MALAVILDETETQTDIITYVDTAVDSDIEVLSKLDSVLQVEKERFTLQVEMRRLLKSE